MSGSLLGRNSIGSDIMLHCNPISYDDRYIYVKLTYYESSYLVDMELKLLILIMAVSF